MTSTFTYLKMHTAQTGFANLGDSRTCSEKFNDQSWRQVNKYMNKIKGSKDEVLRSLTINLRQSQSSTKGWPAGRTVLSSFGPSSEPKRSFPISSILLSTCNLWDITSNSCFWASSFLEEPSGDTRYCAKKEKVQWGGGGKKQHQQYNHST